MNIYVGITDFNWYQKLISIPNLDEVNFWQPGGNRQFNVLKKGELFLFKLHAPQNYIVGGGFFAYSNILPLSLAWDSFVEKNGVSSLEEMRRRIGGEGRCLFICTNRDLLFFSYWYIDPSEFILMPESSGSRAIS